jgi:hypothetical protein
MYTLKIEHKEFPCLCDSCVNKIDKETEMVQPNISVYFFPAKLVVAHGYITTSDPKEMSEWNREDYEDLRHLHVLENENQKSLERSPGRLLHLQQGGIDSWYLASSAWLLGPTGSTIERLV